MSVQFKFQNSVSKVDEKDSWNETHVPKAVAARLDARHRRCETEIAHLRESPFVFIFPFSMEDSRQSKRLVCIHSY